MRLVLRRVRPIATDPPLLLGGKGVPAVLAKVNWMPVTVAGSTPAGSVMAEPVWNGPLTNWPGVQGAGAVQ